MVLSAERRRPIALRPLDEELIAGNQEIADEFHRQGTIPAALQVRGTFATRFSAAHDGA